MSVINANVASVPTTMSAVPQTLIGGSLNAQPNAFQGYGFGTQSGIGANMLQPPSKLGTIVKNVAIFGGIGAALGLGASFLPGIGPIVAVIGGAAGAIVGLAKGIGEANEKQREFEYFWGVRRPQQESVGHMLGQRWKPLARSTESRKIDDIVSRVMTRLDTDKDGKIAIPQANAGRRILLATADTKANADGFATAAELTTLLSTYDTNKDGTLTFAERQAMRTALRPATTPAAPASSSTLVERTDGPPAPPSIPAV